MAIDFPNSPSVDDTFGVTGGPSWRWNGTTWDMITQSSDNGADVLVYGPAGTGAVDTTIKARLDQKVHASNFGVAGDGTADDTTKLQAAIDHAESLATVSTTGGVKAVYPVLDLGGKFYAVSADLTIQAPIIIQNGSIIARSDFSGTAIINASADARGWKIQNVELDGGMAADETAYADGILNAAFAAHISNVKVVHFVNYGIRLTEAGQCVVKDCLISECLFNEWWTGGTAEFDQDYSKLTGTGLSVESADGFFNNNMVFLCQTCVAVSASVNQFVNNHFWQYIATTNQPATWYLVKDSSASGSIWTNNYFDNGCVQCIGDATNGFGQAFTSNFWNWSNALEGGNIMLELQANKASDTGSGLCFIGNVFFASGFGTFPTLTTAGSGSWATDKQYTWIGNTAPDDSTLQFFDGGTQSFMYHGQVEWDGSDFTYGAGDGAEKIHVNGAVGNARGYTIQTGAEERWAMLATTAAESGSEAGSNFALNSYDDDGNYLATPIGVIRSTGTTQLNVNTVTDDTPFLDFVATADADATSAISTLTTSGATTHHIQISINGTPAWIAVSTTDPT